MILAHFSHAHKNLCDHTFILGKGYRRFELHEMRPHGPLSESCDPPTDCKDGSLHILQSPGQTEVRFLWVKQEKAWTLWPAPRVIPTLAKGVVSPFCPLAYSARFLGSHGWSYLREDDLDVTNTFYHRAVMARNG